MLSDDCDTPTLTLHVVFRLAFVWINIKHHLEDPHEHDKDSKVSPKDTVGHHVAI